MITLKSLLTEGVTKNEFIDFLMDKVQPLINKIIDSQKKKAKEDGEEFTKYDEEMAELTLKFDLLKALGQYTLSTDKLKSANASNSNKGSITITAVIVRDGQEYGFTTDVIYAGGYNIQKLHFRYLTKTKLPKQKVNPEADKVKTEIKKLTAGQKLKNEIDNYKKRISELEKSTEEWKKMSDDEVLSKDESWNAFKDITWQKIVDRGAADNFNNDEKVFIAKQKQIKADALNKKTRAISFNDNEIKYLKDAIKKSETKLNKLASA